jgi:hypothetical protein
MDPVPQPGPQPHQIDPVPQQRPQLPHRRRGNPGFWQQVRPQQLSQDRGVDLVVLQPRRGDRLAPRRVHQVRAEPVILQQLAATHGKAYQVTQPGQVGSIFYHAFGRRICAPNCPAGTTQPSASP